MPLVWLRESTSGCPWPLAPPGQFRQPQNWFQPGHVADILQVAAHGNHELDLGVTVPFGPDPLNGVIWIGGQENILKQLPDRYMSAIVPFDAAMYPNAPAQLNAEGRVMRFMLRLPELPCASFPDCPLTGSEELRYWSLSFIDADGTTVESIGDVSLTPDANGYVSLVVSFGTPLPPHVIESNGYSIAILPEFDLLRMDIRNLITGESFGCSTANVPHRTAEHHPNGGYMSEYAPFVIYPLAVDLPPVALPFPQFGSCDPP
jgi:hypothetical protein